eukprot:1146251-Pelagomonas_calceolata.AAC.2
MLTTSFPSHREDVSTLAERVRPDEISVEVGSKTLTLGVALVAVCKDTSDSSPENLLRPRVEERTQDPNPPVQQQLRPQCTTSALRPTKNLQICTWMVNLCSTGDDEAPRKLSTSRVMQYVTSPVSSSIALRVELFSSNTSLQSPIGYNM